MTVRYLFLKYAEKEWVIILAYEQDERASADYDVEISFSQDHRATGGGVKAFSGANPLVFAKRRAR